MTDEQPHANPAVIQTGNLFGYMKSFYGGSRAKYVSESTKSREAALKFAETEEGLRKIMFLAVVDELRTIARMDLLKRYGVPKRTHEVASGLALDGYEICLKDREHIWVESEQEDKVIQGKKQILEELAKTDLTILSPNMQFETVDVLKRNDLKRAARHFEGLDYNLLSSGLFAYFDKDKKPFASANISESMPIDSRFITVDCFTKQLIDEITRINPHYPTLMKKMEERTKSKMYDWAWNTSNDQRRMFENDFKVVAAVPFTEYVSQLTLLNNPNIPKEAFKILDAMHLAQALVLTPRK